MDSPSPILGLRCPVTDSLVSLDAEDMVEARRGGGGCKQG